MQQQKSRQIAAATANAALTPAKKPKTKTILDPASAEGDMVAAVFKPLEEKARISFFRTY